MVCRINSATIHGIEACVVAVETDISDGLPGFDMVGLLSSEVREARERVRTALKNSGFLVPPKRITINLAPADLRKSGTYFDIPIAISILISMGIVQEEKTRDCLFAGELSLDGQAVRVNGILPIVLMAEEKGMERCFIPKDNLGECRMVDGIKVIGISDLRQLVYALTTNEYEEGEGMKEKNPSECEYIYDFCEVKGQAVARRGAEITAAGMHNMLMIGTPGAGKTMIAKCMPSILPEMTKKEKTEVAKIQSVAGILNNNGEIPRPFRAPHHSCTITALTGGGMNPKPGEITLAHRGVLFLDEFPEFSRQAIEVLRQPLEEGYILLSRAGGRYRFPADFIFLAASNPCKCGYYPDRSKCKCTQHDVKKYLDKISGPIMDRIDLCINIEPVKYEELNDSIKAESSKEIKKRVEQARFIQQERYKNEEIDFNGQLDGRYINEYCPLGRKERELMEDSFHKFSLSARAYHKIIKVARTIGDLAGEKNITHRHLAEAISYRIR